MFGSFRSAARSGAPVTWRFPHSNTATLRNPYRVLGAVRHASPTAANANRRNDNNHERKRGSEAFNESLANRQGVPSNQREVNNRKAVIGGVIFCALGAVAYVKWIQTVEIETKEFKDAIDDGAFERRRP